MGKGRPPGVFYQASYDNGQLRFNPIGKLADGIERASELPRLQDFGYMHQLH